MQSRVPFKNTLFCLHKHHKPLDYTLFTSAARPPIYLASLLATTKAAFSSTASQPLNALSSVNKGDFVEIIQYLASTPSLLNFRGLKHQIGIVSHLIVTNPQESPLWMLFKSNGKPFSALERTFMFHEPNYANYLKNLRMDGDGGLVDSPKLTAKYIPKFMEDAREMQQQLEKSQQLSDLHGHFLAKGAFTLESAVNFIYGKDAKLSTGLERFSLFKALLANQAYFISQELLTRQYTEYRFIARSQGELDHFNRLLELQQIGHGDYRSFVQRLMRILVADHSISSTSPVESDHHINSAPHSPTTPHILHTFTEMDKLFLECVCIYGLSNANITSHPCYEFSHSLLESMSFPCDQQHAIKFLTQIGVWRWWDYVKLFNGFYGNADFWCEKEHNLSMTRAAKLRVKTILSGVPLVEQEIKTFTPLSRASNLQSPLIPLYTQSSVPKKKGQSDDQELVKDACSSIRHDFGNLLALSIDDAAVAEVDDALSLELDSVDPSNSWIHIHIADPSAYIQPNDALGRLALANGTSIYLPECQLSMLPNELSARRTSLEPFRPNLTLTFSVKLDFKGDVLDYRVRAGIIRNLVKLKYKDVDLHLGGSEFIAVKPLPQHLPGQATFNSTNHVDDSNLKNALNRHLMTPNATIHTTSTQLSHITEDIVRILHQLDSLAFRHYLRRIENGHGFTPMIPRSDVHLTPQSPHVLTQVPSFSRIFESMPKVSVALDATYESPSKQVVAELMLLAGRIASLFSRDHPDAPIICRSQELPSDVLLSIQRLLADSKHGKISFEVALTALPALPASNFVCNLSPKPHDILGICGYAQTTSPIRRASDLLNHWQMKAALLGTTPPFCIDQLHPIMETLMRRERHAKKLQRAATDHWVKLFLLQNTFSAQFYGSHLHGSGMIKRLGVPSHICHQAPIRIWDAFVCRGDKDLGGASSMKGRGDVMVFIKDLGIKQFIRGDALRRLHSVGEWIKIQVAMMDVENMIVYWRES